MIPVHASPLPPIRTLLSAYALRWSRAVLAACGSRRDEEDEAADLFLLDPYAGADHPRPAGVAPLSVRLLAEVCAAAPRGVRVRAALLEEDPVKLAWVEAALGAAGLAGRVGRLPDPTAGAGIVLGEGEWPEPERWAEAAREAGAALLLLDPPSARRLPFERLLPFLRSERADLLLRFPVAELRRLAAYGGSTLADLPPYPKRIVAGCSALLGDARQEWFFAWHGHREEAGEAAAERAVVERLAERLRAESDRTVRLLELPAGGTDGPEYLLLVAREPARALLLNEVLFEARRAGALPWPDEAEDGFVRHQATGELELFGADSRDATRERVVDALGLAHHLATRFAGRRVAYADVLRELRETELFEEDVRHALLALRRDGRALFRSLSHREAEVAFPRAGALRRPAPGGRRRKVTEADLSLALDPESE